MSLDATLRLLTKASGLTAADLAAAIPRASAMPIPCDEPVTSARFPVRSNNCRLMVFPWWLTTPGRDRSGGVRSED